jgi:hypothetical protein
LLLNRVLNKVFIFFIVARTGLFDLRRHGHDLLLRLNRCLKLVMCLEKCRGII